MSTFRLLIVPEGKGPALPLSTVNIIRPGEKLKYEPIHIPEAIKDKAEIAILLVPLSKAGDDGDVVAAGAAAGVAPAIQKASATQPATEKPREQKGKDKQKDLVVMEARHAKNPTEWVIPTRASIVGVVFGPHGLDVKKVSSMVAKNEDLIPQLADYAQQTATVEALVQVLSQVEESPTPGSDVNSALRGFSTSYGLAVPKLDTSAPTNQQASQLLQAVLPSLSTYDPLTSQRSAVVAQSTGLASSVAGLFFGTPVGLAAGGAALFENLRIMAFPDTDFHAAFTQPVANSGLALCSKDQKLKPRTRPAYLWMLRLPDVGAPAASLPDAKSLPLGWKSTLKVACANSNQLKVLPRARDWELVSTAHSAEVPVAVTVGTSDDTLDLDLSHAKLPEGQYRLVAKWDWDPMEVQGAVNLHSLSDFSHVAVSPDSEDLLVEGTGLVKVQLTGADFEFVNKVTIAPSGDSKATPKEVSMTLAKGSASGEQTTLAVEVDTSGMHAGSYILKLAQTNGTPHDLGIVVHPPNPTLTNLPLRVNLGEPQQAVTLQGTGLERIEGLISEGAAWALAPAPSDAHNLPSRKATVKLSTKVKIGEALETSMKVTGLHSPLKASEVLVVAGPRPKITGATESSSPATNVALRHMEIAAGGPVSFAIQTQNAGSHPTFSLSCANAGDVKQRLALHPGDRSGSAQLDFAGEDTLFLSVDPGSVGHSGCELEATVTTEETGSSDPYPLGHVIRLPRIEKFLLSDEKGSGHLFLGSLTGEELQAIEKTGWDGKNGYPVQGFPIPVPGDAQEQSLKIELPWPPPSPRAPLYVWLRGETEGRITQAKY